MAQLAEALKVRPEELPERVNDIVEKLRAAEKEIERVRVGQLLAGGAAARRQAPVTSPASTSSPTTPTARPAPTCARWRSTSAAGWPRAAPVPWSCSAPPTARCRWWPRSTTRARERGVSANDLVRALGPLVGGKGGGKDDVAQGGGTDATRVDEALALVRDRGRPHGRSRPDLETRRTPRHRPGEARIGVARSDPSGFLATPVETVPRGQGDLARLAALVAEEEAVEVVVGLPRSLSGGEGPAAARVREFAGRLARPGRPRAGAAV